MRSFIIFVIFSLALVRIISADFECTPGVPYVENDCNNCLCSENRVLECSFITCIGGNYDELRRCKVGTTTQKDCNSCICVQGLGTVCTNNECFFS